MSMKKIDWLIFTALAVLACDPKIETPEVTRGNADFSKYIAIGNSLTAGYANNGLYSEGQEVSYPNLLALQMQTVGGGEFKQPLMPENGSGYFYLHDFANGKPDIREVSPHPDANKKVEGPFNNLAVPGIRVKDAVVPGYGIANKYYNRMLPADQEMKSYVQLVGESEPTFFTCWMGNNDALDYAASGGAFGIDGLPVTGQHGLTDPDSEFMPAYTALMNAVGGAKGVVITVPDITLAPVFTTIPKALIPVLDTATLNTLNKAYAPYNQGVELYNSQVPEAMQLKKIVFVLGANFPVIVDKSIPDPLPKMSQLTADGFLLLNLPTDSLVSPKDKGPGWGTVKPIPDQYSLTEKEADIIRSYIDDYNEIIKSFASDNIAVYESTPLMQKLAAGMFVNGYPVNAKYIEGGIFSLDGAHLTPRGNALVASELIRTINQKFGSTIPTPVITNYKGVDIPF